MPKFRLPRVVPVVSWVLFLWCAGLSIPSFGQSAASAPPSGTNAVTLSPISGISAAVDSIQPKFDAMDTKLQAVKGELDKADRRTRQTRQYGLFLLALNAALVVVIILVLTGGIGRFPLLSQRDLVTLRTLRAIRKRQAKLKVVINELKAYLIQTNENHDEVVNALSLASRNIIKEKEVTA